LCILMFMYLDSRQRRVTSFTWVQSPLNFHLNPGFICYRRFQIF
jgi:hypothetical protein